MFTVLNQYTGLPDGDYRLSLLMRDDDWQPFFLQVSVYDSDGEHARVRIENLSHLERPTVLTSRSFSEPQKWQAIDIHDEKVRHVLNETVRIMPQLLFCLDHGEVVEEDSPGAKILKWGMSERAAASLLQELERDQFPANLFTDEYSLMKVLTGSSAQGSVLDRRGEDAILRVPREGDDFWDEMQKALRKAGLRPFVHFLFYCLLGYAVVFLSLRTITSFL